MHAKHNYRNYLFSSIAFHLQGPNDMIHVAKTRRALLNTTAITRYGRTGAYAMLGLLTASSPALALNDNALPTGGVVASGDATFNYGGTQLDINQSSQRVVIDWNSFNIGTAATTQFNQSGASAIAVNRVNDVNPSQILGNLRANGQVVILNTNGVIFGQNASIDVSGLLVSTGQIDADAFMQNGAINLSNINAANGTIENNGNITINNAGLAAFVAPNVINNGVITARLGKIALASGGDKATVDLYGDGLVEMTLDDNASKALIDNKGQLKADGGVIAVTAKAAKEVVDSVINMGGVVEANTVGVKNGKIILGATNADVVVSGKVNAKGGNGVIKATSNRNIGVTADAEFNADAGLSGNGGDVRLIADQSLVFLGAISARGGSENGNGGFVDTSGLEAIYVDGRVDASAENGESGTWLIDPSDLEIVSGSNSNVSGNPFTPTGGFFSGVSRLNVSNITNALNAGTNVTITTAGSPDKLLQDGTIKIKTSILKTLGTAATLTMNAVGSIIQEAGTVISSTANKLNLNMTADKSITLNGSISTNGGNVALKTGNAFTLASGKTVNAGAGTVSVRSDKVNINGNMSADTIAFSRGDSQGRITVGDTSLLDDLFTMSIDQNELNRLTASNLIFGDATRTVDSNILIKGANLGAFNTTTLNTRRDDSSSNENVTFEGTNTTKALTVNADDSISLANNATINASGNVDLNANTNALSSGDFHMDNNSRINTNGFNFESDAKNTRLDNGARIDAAGGNIDIYSTGIFNSASADSVRTTGTGTVDINQNVGGSIQNAVNAVQNTGTGRNTISVGAGAFNETVTVGEDNFTLVGTAPNHGSVIDGVTAGFNVTGNNAIIDNFTIKNTAGANGNGVLVNNGDNAKIIDNVIFNTSADAIRLVNSTNSQVSGNYIGYIDAGETVGTNNNINGDGIYASGADGIVIQSNMIAETNRTGTYDVGSGIQVLNTNGATIGGDDLTKGNVITNASWDGIRVANSSGVTAQFNTITTDASDSDARVGIYFGNVRDSNIKNNNVSNAHRYGGIYTQGGGNLTVADNTVNNSDETGILMQAAWGTNTISGNTIDNTGKNIKSSDGAISGDGIRAIGVSDLEVSGNFVGTLGGVDNIHGDGVYVSGSDYAEITGNTITQTDGLGAWDVGSGVQVLNSDHTTVDGNIMSDLGWDGIRAASGTDDITIKNNKIKNVTRTGIYLGGVNTADVVKNKIKGAEGYYGIDVAGGSNVDLVRNTISDVALDGIFMHGTAGENLIKKNKINKIDGDAIRADAVSNLVVDANEIGLLNGVNNIKGDGIELSNLSNATVKNNKIKNAKGDGVYLNGVNETTVKRNTISNVKRNGIEVDGGDSVTVRNNTIDDTDRDGINVDGTSKLLVARNVIGANGGYQNIGGDGIELNRLSGAIVRNNTVKNTEDNGIKLYNVSGTAVRGNKIKHVAKNGILADGGEGLKIKRNTIDYTGRDGIHVSDVSGLTVARNKIGTLGRNNNIKGDGIQLVDVVNGKVRRNKIENVKENGIQMDDARHVSVAYNRITDAGQNGIYAGYSNDLNIRNNRIFDVNGDGIKINGVQEYRYLEDEYNFKISNNDIRKVGGDGIDVDGAWYVFTRTLIKNNTIRNVGDNGIELDTIGYANVVGNSISNRTQRSSDGIDATDVFKLDLTGNTIWNFADQGIDAADVGLFNADGNTIYDVGYDGISLNGFSSAYLINNTITNTVNGNGIVVANGSDVQIGDGIDNKNTVTDAGLNGIFVSNVNSTIVNANQITNSGQDGILVTGQADWLSTFVNEDNQNENPEQPPSGSQGSFGTFLLQVGGAVATITDNIVTGSGLNGIEVGGLESATIGDGVDENSVGNIVTDSAVSGIRASIVNTVEIALNQIDQALFGITTDNNNETTLAGNIITNIDDTGIVIGGQYNQSVVLRDNSVQSNNDGALFQSGAIDLQGINSFDSLNDGLIFDPGSNDDEREFVKTDAPSDLSLVGNTFGTTQFTNQEGYYIRFANGALFDPGAPTLLDARFSTFDGYTPNSFTLPFAEFSTLQAKLFDYDNDNTLGDIFFTFLGGIDGNRVLPQQFLAGLGAAGTGSVTITGLPFAFLRSPAGSAFNLANIAPAAGGDANDLNNIDTAAGGDAEDLNNIDTAAGSENANCWGGVYNAASANTPVTYSLSEDPASLIADQAGCGSAGQGTSL